MKIALIRQRYTPFGGAERFVANAVQALRAEGASLTVVTRQWKSGSEGESLICNPPYLGSLWRDWSFARCVCNTLKEHAFDLVQSHERIACCDIYRAGDGVHAQWLQNRARSLGGAARLALALNPYHRYTLAAERRLFASSRLRAVICNSRMVAAEIRRWFALAEDRLHVIYNGVDLEVFHPRVREQYRRGIRDKLGIGEAEPLFVFVGSGFERKGVPQLLRALAQVQAAQLAVVGKDKDELRMRELSRKLGVRARVHFIGPQEDVRPWYGASDCFVLPTLYDPFPNAALEALACGLPVITTSACGAAELLEHGCNGYVCQDPLSVEELASCIRAGISGAAASRPAARATAERCGLARMAAELRQLYLVTLSGPGKTP